MRALTNAYQAPQGACPTFQALYRALEEFERDLHWHVHLENNILFPRAIAQGTMDVVRVRPELVVEVTFDHASGGRIRHGTKILRWRDDKAPKECLLEQMQQ